MNIQKSNLNPMCANCTRLGTACNGSTCQDYTGCVYKKNTDPEKTICKPRMIYQPDATPDAPYNVQLWHSYDGGKTFWYAGYGRFFNDYYEAEAWRKQQRRNLQYDLMFGRLGNGTTVCNMAREEHGDYQHVAHIDDCGAISWDIDPAKLPPYVLEDVNASAARDAAKYREQFLALPKLRALDELNRWLTAGQYLQVFHEEKITEKSVEEIYRVLIDYVCRNGKRVMPAA